MNLYASNSCNSYSRKYLSRNIRNSKICNFLDNKSFLISPKNKMKQDTVKRGSLNSGSCSFLDDNELHHDFNEDYYDCDRVSETVSENYNYLNYNENQMVSDENSGIIDDSLEEYSIDFIDEAHNLMLDNSNFVQNQDQPFINDVFHNTHFAPVTPRRKRKQGIVGRPTLSSPQRLLSPDNVYSHCFQSNDKEKYFTDNNHRTKNSQINRNKKSVIQNNVDEFPTRGGNRNFPRILLKPSLSGYYYVNDSQINYNTIEPDAQLIAQRQMANREFARNLVARAERQGTVIDKNKIPHSVFEQGPVDQLFQSSSNHQITELTEIKDSEELVTLPYTTTFSIADLRRIPASIEVIHQAPVPQLAPQTASDILKKRKMENRR